MKSAKATQTTTLSRSQARRRLRRLLAPAAAGQSLIITENGREMCLIRGVTADESCWHTLI
jgi:antitoxin (DNA-binding transcriptional repressor) of toxin-antitoxin stability system